MSRVSQWSPYNRYIQAGLVDGKFLNAAYTMLAAGPPRLANLGGLRAFEGSETQDTSLDEVVFPIGVVQNFNLSHNRQFSRIFEIGSERSFWISGRTMGQIGLSRIMYHGPSLLRTLYAYYQDLIPPTVFNSVIGNDSIGWATTSHPHNVKVPPGYDNLFLNLASDLFTQPVGLLTYFKDSDEETVGAAYLESAVVPNHTIATDAQGTILQENAAVQFERMLPVQVSALALVDLSASDNELLGLDLAA